MPRDIVNNFYFNLVEQKYVTEKECIALTALNTTAIEHNSMKQLKDCMYDGLIRHGLILQSCNRYVRPILSYVPKSPSSDVSGIQWNA